MDKRDLSERNIRTRFITAAQCATGWDEMLRIREEGKFTKARASVCGKRVSQCKG